MSRLVAWRLLGVVGLLAASAVVGSPPAHGQDGQLVVQVVGGRSVFDLRPIAPGVGVHGEVDATNRSPDAARLSVSTVEVVGQDGCSPVELKLEMPCGTGPGHLIGQLELTIEHVRADGNEQIVWTGALRDLDEVSMGSELPTGATHRYRFTATLPAASGNETQGDSVRFDLRFDLGMDIGSASVAGTGVVRNPDVVEVLGITLPRTGVDVFRLIGLAALAAGAGLALVRGSRRLVPDQAS